MAELTGLLNPNPLLIIDLQLQYK